MKSHQPLHMFAVTPPAFEGMCARELECLGLGEVLSVDGGVEFQGGLRELYAANLWLRTASRVLVRVSDFTCRDFPTLYKKALQLPWGRFIRPATRIQVRASSHASRLQHTGRMAETLESAILHSLGTPETSPKGPPQLVLARFEDNHCHLSVDSSGELLHRRGYRKSAVTAPLRENLAAGILKMLDWQPETPLVDPMCGSGSFAIEAALMACRMAPGRQRGFAFMNWPHYRPGLWDTLLAEADRQVCENRAAIVAADMNPAAVEAACRNAEAAGVRAPLDIRRARLSELSPPQGPGLILCNPPYGKRLAAEEDIKNLYRDLGQTLRHKCPGWTLGLICPPRPAGATGLPLEKMAAFHNGGIKIQLFRVKL